ncbi:MAG: hypothetical protein ABL967_09215 [Bryobacteraceae bacterium]
MEAPVRVTLSPNALTLLGYEKKEENCSSTPLQVREDLLESLLGSRKPTKGIPVTVLLEPATFQSFAPAPPSTYRPAPVATIEAEGVPEPVLEAEPYVPETDVYTDVHTDVLRAETPSSGMLLGVHNEAALRQLIESEVRISGLVVSVARTGDIGPDSSALLRELSEDLLTPEDFGCNIGADEFLLYCANQRGADAQRRLRLITQHLWDLQLRLLNSGVTPFAWGAVEVEDEPMGEAVAAATERMNETLRTRSGFLGNASQNTAARAAFGD